MPELINNRVLKGFIRDEINSRFEKVYSEIDKLYKHISILREEIMLKNMKGGKQ